MRNISAVKIIFEDPQINFFVVAQNPWKKIYNNI